MNNGPKTPKILLVILAVVSVMCAVALVAVIAAAVGWYRFPAAGTTVSGKESVSFGSRAVEVANSPDTKVSVSTESVPRQALEALDDLVVTGFIGAPVEITSSQPDTELTLSRTFPAPLPADQTALFFYFDEASRSWVPADSTLSADRITVSAKTDRIGLWTDIVFGSPSELADMRSQLSPQKELFSAPGYGFDGYSDKNTSQWHPGVDKPTCDEHLPEWVKKSTVPPDAPDNSRRWCVGKDPENPDDVQVKLANNSGTMFRLVSAPLPHNVSVETIKPSVALQQMNTFPQDPSAGAGNDNGAWLLPGQVMSMSYSHADLENSEWALNVSAYEGPAPLWFVGQGLSQLYGDKLFQTLVTQPADSLLDAIASRSFRDIVQSLRTSLDGALTDEDIDKVSAVLLWDAYQHGDKSAPRHQKSELAFSVTESPTEIVVIKPFDRQGNPQPGFSESPAAEGNSVQQTYDGDSCFPSGVAIDSDIYTCGPTAFSWLACYPRPNMGTDVISCLLGLDDSEFITVDSKGGSYRKGASEYPDVSKSPGLLELANGFTCRYRLGGAGGGAADGRIISYYCTDPYGDFSRYSVVEVPGQSPEFGLDTSGDVWTADFGETSINDDAFPPPEKVKITKAYFAGWAD